MACPAHISAAVQRHFERDRHSEASATLYAPDLDDDDEDEGYAGFGGDIGEPHPRDRALDREGPEQKRTARSSNLPPSLPPFSLDVCAALRQAGSGQRGFDFRHCTP
ncbi:hypothetical protein PaG_05181 [Moesziomyces aphidis]|uniref:Uncharacterized protein n=1 Tax=Moesziomyces aphidis TaxID=84754 RepID=W3VI98_MOEAP|nr:hypothetical protein PaG_05181 [Moesziomyces aphidis]